MKNIHTFSKQKYNNKEGKICIRQRVKGLSSRVKKYKFEIFITMKDNSFYGILLRSIWLSQISKYKI